VQLVLTIIHAKRWLINKRLSGWPLALKKHAALIGVIMPNIKIIPDSRDAAKPSHVPKSSELSVEQPRYRNTGKPPLPLTSSFSPQAKQQIQ